MREEAWADVYLSFMYDYVSTSTLLIRLDLVLSHLESANLPRFQPTHGVGSEVLSIASDSQQRIAQMEGHVVSYGYHWHHVEGRYVQRIGKSMLRQGRLYELCTVLLKVARPSPTKSCQVRAGDNRPETPEDQLPPVCSKIHFGMAQVWHNNRCQVVFVQF